MFVQSMTRPDNPAVCFFQFSFRLGRVLPLTFSAFFGSRSMSSLHLFSQRLCSLSIVLKDSPDMFAMETNELMRGGHCRVVTFVR